METIIVNGPASFERDFPDVIVGPRTGPNRRSQDEEDLWIARRALHALTIDREIIPPFRLRRIPQTTICRTPDFELCSSMGLGFLECTEATIEDEQKEMAALEDIDEPTLVGAVTSYRGRSIQGRGGDRGFVGNEPDRMVADDIRSALERKSSHYPGEIRARTILSIYLNSNPAMVVHDLNRLSPLLSQLCRGHGGFMRVVVVNDRKHLIY